MATALAHPSPTPAATSDAQKASTAPAGAAISPRSRLIAFTATMVGAITLIWVAVTALMVTLADTTTVGAVGVGAFAAFWLGGGFGLIFGSAAAFGRDH